MYKLLLVDDDLEMSKKIIKYTPFNELDIEVVGVAADGESGLQQIYDNMPDIVIADVDMPCMNGLEMLKKVREKGLNTNFVFLTGHRKFEYIQQAMNLGAVSYLVKPAFSDDIMEHLKKIIEDIKERRVTKSELYQKTIYSLLISDSDEKMTKRYLLDLKIDVEDTLFLCFSVRFKDVFVTDLEKINSMFDCSYYHYNEDNDTYTFVVAFDEEGYADEIYQKINEFVITNDKHVVFCIGCMVDELSNVYRSYIQSYNFFNYQLDLDESIYYADEFDDMYEQKNSYAISEYTEIIDMLRVGDHQEFIEYLRNKFLIMGKDKYSLRYIKMYCFEICNLCVYYSNEKTHVEMEHTIKKIDLLIDINLIFDTLKNHIEKCFVNSDSVMKKNQRIVRDVKNYVHQNYNKSISIDEIAKNYIYLAPNYLSQLFLRETGMRFKFYLKKYRIEKAKEFLYSGNYTVMEVANMVGYNDANYFRTVFKDITKKNPVDFLK